MGSRLKGFTSPFVKPDSAQEMLLGALRFSAGHCQGGLCSCNSPVSTAQRLCKHSPGSASALFPNVCCLKARAGMIWEHCGD